MLLFKPSLAKFHKTKQQQNLPRKSCQKSIVRLPTRDVWPAHFSSSISVPTRARKTSVVVCNKCTSSYLRNCAHTCCCTNLTDCCTDFFQVVLGCVLLIFLGNVPFLCQGPLLGLQFFSLPLLIVNVSFVLVSLFLYLDFVTIFNNYLIQGCRSFYKIKGPQLISLLIIKHFNY